MADRINRRFKTWNALQLAMKRAGVSNHGSTATLLLEAFIEDGGRLLASTVAARGLCEEGKFYLWRDELIKTGWLIWSQSQADKGQYFAGKKLIPYLNKEKLASKEVVTKDEVPSKTEFEDLKERMNRIEEVVQELKKSMEPPETDEKKRARERAADRLTLLAKTH